MGSGLLNKFFNALNCSIQHYSRLDNELRSIVRARTPEEAVHCIGMKRADSSLDRLEQTRGGVCI